MSENEKQTLTYSVIFSLRLLGRYDVEATSLAEAMEKFRRNDDVDLAGAGERVELDIRGVLDVNGDSYDLRPEE